MEVYKHSKLVSATGGAIQFVTAEGEVLARVQIPAGIIEAAPYFQLVPPGCAIETEGEIAVFDGPATYVVQQAPEMFKTAANPDFEPSNDQMARKLETALARLADLEAVNRKAQRLEAAKRIDAMPTAKAEPASEGPQVVE